MKIAIKNILPKDTKAEIAAPEIKSNEMNEGDIVIYKSLLKNVKANNKREFTLKILEMFDDKKFLPILIHNKFELVKEATKLEDPTILKRIFDCCINLTIEKSIFAEFFINEKFSLTEKLCKFAKPSPNYISLIMGSESWCNIFEKFLEEVAKLNGDEYVQLNEDIYKHDIYLKNIFFYAYLQNPKVVYDFFMIIKSLGISFETVKQLNINFENVFTAYIDCAGKNKIPVVNFQIIDIVILMGQLWRTAYGNKEFQEYLINPQYQLPIIYRAFQINSTGIMQSLMSMIKHINCGDEIIEKMIKDSDGAEIGKQLFNPKNIDCAEILLNSLNISQIKKLYNSAIWHNEDSKTQQTNKEFIFKHLKKFEKIEQKGPLDATATSSTPPTTPSLKTLTTPATTEAVLLHSSASSNSSPSTVSSSSSAVTSSLLTLSTSSLPSSSSSSSYTSTAPSLLPSFSLVDNPTAPSATATSTIVATLASSSSSSSSSPTATEFFAKREIDRRTLSAARNISASSSSSLVLPATEITPKRKFENEQPENITKTGSESVKRAKSEGHTLSRGK